MDRWQRLPTISASVGPNKARAKAFRSREVNPDVCQVPKEFVLVMFLFCQFWDFCFESVLCVFYFLFWYSSPSFVCKFKTHQNHWFSIVLCSCKHKSIYHRRLAAFSRYFFHTAASEFSGEKYLLSPWYYILLCYCPLKPNYLPTTLGILEISALHYRLSLKILSPLEQMPVSDLKGMTHLFKPLW